MHGARSRLRQSANLRSDCKHGSGADAQCILCPGDLMPQPQDSTLCTVDWVLVHVTTHAASTLTRTIWSSSYGSSADRPKAHIYLYFVDKAGCSTTSLLTRWPRWGYVVANLAHPSVMPPQCRRDGKSRATLCRQGTRLGKRQRAEARELEQMRSHDLYPHGARPAPAWITYSSLLGQHQRRERARPLRWSFHSMLVQQPRHVAANQEDGRTWRRIVLRCCLCNVSDCQLRKDVLGRHGQNPFYRPLSQWSRLLVLSHWRVQ